MKISLIIILLSVFKISFGQDSLLILKEAFKIKNAGFEKAWEKLQEGNEFYKNGIFYDAIFFYETANRYNSNNPILNYRLGTCYLEINRIEKANEYLKNAYRLAPTLTDDIEFKLGRSYQLNYQFDEALVYFKSYFKKSKSADIGISRYRYIMECMNGKDFLKNSPNTKVTNLGVNVNSENSDYMPFYCEMDSSLFFNSTRKIGFQRKEQIYCSKQHGFNWDQSQLFDTSLFVNRFSNYGLSYLSKDMKFMLVVGCGGKGKYKYNNKCHLYSLAKDASGWKEPTYIEGINSDLKETYATVNDSRDTMYFTRTDNSGTTDIYYATWNNQESKWRIPFKLGTNINTKLNEYVLFVSKDTLYFASDGLVGLGGYDIYMTIKNKDNSWTDPKNLGYPINSPFDEFGFSKSIESMFVASKRNTSLGLYNILKIENKK